MGLKSIKPKAFALDPRIGSDPQRQNCEFGVPNMLVAKNAKICVTPNANAKICVTPTLTPNASRWNIGGVGPPMQNSRIGHVDFMLFVSLSLALGSQ